MKHCIFWILFLFVFTSCNYNRAHNQNPITSLSEDFDCIIKINELNDFLNQTENNVLLADFYNSVLLDPLPVLSKINPIGPTYIATSKAIDSGNVYLIVTKNHETVFDMDSTEARTEVHQNIKDLKKIVMGSKTYYQKNIGAFYLASNSIEVLNDLNRYANPNKLIPLLETADDTVLASSAFNTNENNQLSQLLLNPFDPSQQHAVALDFNISSDQLGYNGVIKAKDSSHTFLNCFRNSKPSQLHALDIVPSDIKQVVGITFNDYNDFRTQQSKRYQIPKNPRLERMLSFTDQITKADDFLILHSLDNTFIMESVEDKQHIDSFRDIEIFSLNDSLDFKGHFQPFFEIESLPYFCQIEDFTVFSDNTENLKALISSVRNNNTLINSQSFKNLKDQLSDEMSVLIYNNDLALSEFFGRDLQGFNANIVQYTYEKNYAHLNGIFQKHRRQQILPSVAEYFTSKISAEALLPPQAVKNHVTKGYDIVTQDINNVLYLISNSGKILWQKQLDSKILGPVEQMDMYKNGRLQLVFVTSKRLYVIDRNGNHVNPFPLKFKDDITQPLAVFDYDNNKNYRLLVTQGDELLMYDASGKGVNGFNYSSNLKAITSQPKHFRIGSRDYIVFKTDNQLKILNRRGQKRIKVDKTFNFSGNAVYAYKNKFTTTSTLGELIQIDTKGKLTTETLNVTAAHKIDATSKTMVVLSDNKLKIKSRTIDLDYGDYTDPKIFYLNDKIYISITDRQSKKVYLFDSQAKAIPNFPVYGTSAAVLQNLDKDGALELITQDGEDKILVYKVN